MTPLSAGQRVVAVTGGGGGIGAAIAEELGRQGAFVVTMDPLVTLDGSEPLPAPGGDHRRSHRRRRRVGPGHVGVGDRRRRGRASLFEELGRLDAVVNVAGITRPTSFARGSEEDWRGVLAVHLDGYLNVLAAALPMMAAAGHGRILGVTSGSGWRAGRHRRLRLRQAGRRRAHLAAGPARAAGRRRQRHVADRRDPDGHRRARPRASGDDRRLVGHRRALARLDARSPRSSARSAPTSWARTSRGAAAGCSSPAGPRWR